jgi:signal peptidase I
MSESIVRRRFTHALALNVVIPCLGHLYIGRARRAFIGVAAAIAALLLLGFTRWITTPAGYAGAFVVAIVFQVYLAVDAWRATRFLGFQPRWYNRWWAYIVFAIAVLTLASYRSQFRRQILGYDAFRVPGTAMEPTLVAGDHILVDTKAFRDMPPQPGDIVVVTAPDTGISYVRRVLAVDDLSVSVASENRALTPDGRTWGPIARHEVKGRATAIYFSWDFSRIGKHLEAK